MYYFFGGFLDLFICLKLIFVIYLCLAIVFVDIPYNSDVNRPGASWKTWPSTAADSTPATLSHDPASSKGALGRRTL